MVGHVEWVQFARVSHVPSAGEVVHARDPFEEPAGGGAVAAVQLARLAGAASLVTALGDDEYGLRSAARLRELGVGVPRVVARAPSRRAVTLVDDAGERTITTFGPRLEPRGGERRRALERSGGVDAVYFTAGDEAELRAARARARAGREPARAHRARSRRAAGRAGAERRRRDRAARGGAARWRRRSWWCGRRASAAGAIGAATARRARWAAAPLPGARGGLLRLRRLVRGGAHLWPGRGPRAGGRARAGGALRRGVPDGAWTL